MDAPPRLPNVPSGPPSDPPSDPPSLAPVVPLLRLEGAVLFAAAVAAFAWTGAPWWWFVGLLLAPDLSAAGYLRGPRLGARVYNAAHTTAAPAATAVAGLLFDLPALLAVASIWAAHVGMDRALGYGLKLPASFQATHLGPIGRARRRRQDG